MMYRLVFLVLLSAIPGTGSCQWQTIFKDSVHFQFNAVFFLNNDTGFVGGYDFTNPANNGVIFRTMDGGLTWDTSQVQELVLSIHFTDASFGICGGDGGADFITTDMGNTWQKSGYSAPMSDHGFLYFLSPGNGFRATMQSRIQHSSDSGQTWQTVFQSSGGSFFPGTCRMVFPDPQHGFLAQSRFGQAPDSITSISKTSDGGLTWSDLPIPAGFYPYSCHFFNPMAGIAVGKAGAVSRTSDGGNTWSAVPSLGNSTLYDVAFVNDTIGYAIGGFCQYDTTAFSTGESYQTIDGGLSWTAMPAAWHDALLKMTFPSDSTGYAVGFNGLIIKILNANQDLSTGIFSQSHANPVIVYPNPSSSYLYFPDPSSRFVEIYNLQGKRLVLSETEPTASGCRIDISRFAEGIYILRMNGKTFKAVKF